MTRIIHFKWNTEVFRKNVVKEKANVKEVEIFFLIIAILIIMLNNYNFSENLKRFDGN